jgi:DNA-binding XRE family transcriptional regulator
MNTTDRKEPGESSLYNRIAVLRAERGDYSLSLKLALSLGEYFGLPVAAIFSKKPLQPLSQQVYRTSRLMTAPSYEPEAEESR